MKKIDLIFTLAKEQGWTNAELARRHGVSRQMLNNYRFSMSEKMFKKLLRIFDEDAQVAEKAIVNGKEYEIE
jgi:transcriptional regulator with XRE-family HTH domain|tara:strand:+ start:272 stop:487 length:216 start_codon:yes stop_codon:yes gene_type:complete